MAENRETVSQEDIDLLMENGIMDVSPRLDKVPKTIGTKFLEMIHYFIRAKKKSPILPQMGGGCHRVHKVLDDQGRLVCIFKNCEEGKREAAVYILDHPNSSQRSSSSELIGFGGATPTVYIQTNDTSGCLSLAVHGSDIVGKYKPVKSIKTLPQEIHKLCIFHIRFGSADGHAGNTLSKIDVNGIHRFTPIDHQECFSPNYTLWRAWWEERSEANEAFTQEVVNYVDKLDVDGDITFLKICGWDVPSEITVPFKIFTHFLKTAVKLYLTGNEMLELARNKHETQKFNLSNMVSEDKKHGDEVFLQTARKKIEARLREYATNRTKN